MQALHVNAFGSCCLEVDCGAEVTLGADGFSGASFKAAASRFIASLRCRRPRDSAGSRHIQNYAVLRHPIRRPNLKLRPSTTRVNGKGWPGASAGLQSSCSVRIPHVCRSDVSRRPCWPSYHPLVSRAWYRLQSVRKATERQRDTERERESLTLTLKTQHFEK